MPVKNDLKKASSVEAFLYQILLFKLFFNLFRSKIVSIFFYFMTNLGETIMKKNLAIFFSALILLGGGVERPTA